MHACLHGSYTFPRPLAEFSKEGELIWDDEIVKEIKERFKPEKHVAKASAGGKRQNRTG